MRLIFGLVLLVGIALAGGAVYMVQTYVGSYQQALEEERNKSGEFVPLVDIYVADRAIKYGEPITEADVKLAKHAREFVPEGVYSANRPLFVEGEAPRVALRDMERHEVIMEVKLSEPGADPGLTSRLERGQRAFTINVDVSSGVSGFLRPGDRVDVYWTGRPPETDPSVRRGDVTRLIEAGIKLIAIDQTSNLQNTGQATIARTVTVAATPQEVAALAQAQSTGQLTLSLMGHADDTVAEAIEVDQNMLLGIAEPQAEAKVEVPEVCTIRTRKGSDVVEINIPCTN